MNEAEWLACTDPTPMLDCLSASATDRKLRLFLTGYCRLMWHQFHPTQADDSRKAVLVAERFADGQATRKELDDAQWDASDNANYMPDGSGVYALAWVAAATDPATAYRRFLAHFNPENDPELMKQLPCQCEVLRELFGNPYRRAAVNPTWTTWNDGTVRRLAQAIYDDQAFDRLPILADALEEAGCTDQAILDHCRGPGPHVRGCWVVDLILGKE